MPISRNLMERPYGRQRATNKSCFLPSGKPLLETYALWVKFVRYFADPFPFLFFVFLLGSLVSL